MEEIEKMKTIKREYEQDKVQQDNVSQIHENIKVDRKEREMKQKSKTSQHEREIEQKNHKPESKQENYQISKPSETKDKNDSKSKEKSEFRGERKEYEQKQKLAVLFTVSSRSVFLVSNLEGNQDYADHLVHFLLRNKPITIYDYGVDDFEQLYTLNPKVEKLTLGNINK
ncbi:hypothetical protein TSAR_012608 [Trichomalopsis sarcophagae]|uniref:Uncharacterized protein n=1 Tax=Trichomalopsis sarcophagae TaxID=543379 RepID=A0A232EFQ2_9HYME|nr:hypothetical protein TSAR_012608 [Trichomalopsis sarcophagae]